MTRVSASPSAGTTDAQRRVQGVRDDTQRGTVRMLDREVSPSDVDACVNHLARLGLVVEALLALPVPDSWRSLPAAAPAPDGSPRTRPRSVARSARPVFRVIPGGQADRPPR